MGWVLWQKLSVLAEWREPLNKVFALNAPGAKGEKTTAPRAAAINAYRDSRHSDALSDTPSKKPQTISSVNPPNQ